jgi:hypothetical protein
VNSSRTRSRARRPICCARDGSSNSEDMASPYAFRSRGSASSSPLSPYTIWLSIPHHVPRPHPPGQLGHVVGQRPLIRGLDAIVEWSPVPWGSVHAVANPLGDREVLGRSLDHHPPHIRPRTAGVRDQRREEFRDATVAGRRVHVPHDSTRQDAAALLHRPLERLIASGGKDRAEPRRAHARDIDLEHVSRDVSRTFEVAHQPTIPEYLRSAAPTLAPSAHIPCLPDSTAYGNASMASAPVNGRHRPLHIATRRPAGSSLIDCNSYHLIQPLTYRVATGHCHPISSASRFERSSAESPTSVRCARKTPFGPVPPPRQGQHGHARTHPLPVNVR